MGLLTNFKQNDVFRDEKSLAFDGTNDFVDCGSNSSLDVGTNDFSVSVWFKVSTKGGSDYHDIVAKGNTLGSGDGWGICLVESNNAIFFDTNGDVARQNAISPSDSWEFGKWYHIVGTRSNSADTLKLYLNGVLVATNASATNDDLGDASINFKIGTSESGRETKGNISEVAYYNSALTINQVKTIYNGREPYNHKEGVASGNLQAWYRMGDGALDEYALIGDETNITLGNNLITNGTFDADSDWAKSGSGATISSGQATLDLDADTYIYQNVGTVGKVYKMTFDLVVTSGEVKLGTNADFQYTYSAGTYTNESVYLIATTTNRFIFRRATGDLEATIDNVSVQQVGDNAGIMNNMSATDIEGDTP